MKNKIIGGLETQNDFFRNLWTNIWQAGLPMGSTEFCTNPFFLHSILTSTPPTNFSKKTSVHKKVPGIVMYDSLERKLTEAAIYNPAPGISLPDIKRKVNDLLNRFKNNTQVKQQIELYDKWTGLKNVTVDDVTKYISLLQTNSPLYQPYFKFSWSKQPIDIEKSAVVLEQLIAKACTSRINNKFFIDLITSHIFSRKKIALKENNPDAVNDLALLFVLASKFENLLYKNLFQTTILKGLEPDNPGHNELLTDIRNKSRKLYPNIQKV